MDNPLGALSPRADLCRNLLREAAFELGGKRPIVRCAEAGWVIEGDPLSVSRSFAYPDRVPDDGLEHGFAEARAKPFDDLGAVAGATTDLGCENARQAKLGVES